MQSERGFDMSELIFPLPFRPRESYKDGAMAFGSARSNGRKHAGCDLYAIEGTPIFAIKDGVILRSVYPFFMDTYGIDIDHGDFVGRYTEIKNATLGLKVGTKVNKGGQIATVGKMVFPSGTVLQMLHFEMYSGKASGPLTNRTNPPYQRRSDLIDPTQTLNQCVLKRQAAGKS